MRAQLDASRRLWALVGLGAFMGAFIAALGPFDVVFEFLDGGDIDVGIGQGMVVLAGSAIVLWLALAVMVRTGLARPGLPTLAAAWISSGSRLAAWRA